ncbi:bifunctional 4-hydroxy-2-oxoglutarate aldolase/2-dehydro-3-deoxy-phosphogluconate aldolase, partial [Dubosiella newyorkensis]
MNTVIQRFKEIGIIPVIALEHKEDASLLADALCKGGLPAAEITFRTREAAACIKEMRTSHPDMLVGAGTILSTAQVDEAISAGAQFIVSPGFDEEVVKYCIQKDIPVVPGTATATDVQAAYKLGLNFVKVFPAEILGGIKMIKAIAAPYNMMTFMPSGGVSEKNMDAYLKEDI